MINQGGKYFVWIVLSLLFCQNAGAQQSTLEIGQWQVHVPYNRAKAIAEADGVIYCATEDGFFSFDPAFNELKTLSKSDGFHDINISTLAYEPSTQTLVIAYEDAHLDLIRNGEILPITDIARKPITGEKIIHQIAFRDKFAYLASTFGVVVLDLQKLEIKETYSNLGPAGQILNVYASTTLNDSIYLATSNGLMGAALTGTNLLNYQSWRIFKTDAGLPETFTSKTIATFAGSIYAGLNQDKILKFSGKKWLPTAASLTGTEAFQLNASADHLLISTSVNVLLLDAANNVQMYDDPLLAQPRAALQSTGQTYWFADFSRGLIQLQNNTYTAHVPAGPFSNQAFSVYSDNTSTFVLEGGYNQSYEQRGAKAGFYEYTNGQWTNYTAWVQTDPNQFPTLTDLTRAVRNPVNNKLYLGSYGGGLVEWSGLGNFKIYNPTNSPLLSSLNTNNNFTRVPDVAVDASGNTWVINRHQFPNLPGLHVLKPDNTWQSFSFPGFADGSNLERIVIDDNNFKWLALSKNGTSVKGLLVFDETTNNFKHLTPGNVNLPGLDVYTLARDRNNAIWVGTNNGIAGFYDPAQAFSSDFVATLPIINGRPALEGQIVRAIAVDGGNRKWVGTDAGLWLFNEEADKLLANFNTQNSPLLSDKIQDISINHKTGEVFVATDAGLVSYRGSATVTAGKPDCASVFPNPVRPEYDGVVGISGLPNNAHVKITDSAGRLVYETKAAGGTVAWNTRNVAGKRVKSGIYIVFSSTPDGSQSCVSKIAVID
ncbi:type IX secretion system anionic LPS delivery protein PorZ [Adhaeribacter pallidiroseus]|uniref:PorZ N-terminal beta-propeller domain-containing protein n=1 Tax=Adhaeribacter pallidiroseus TaxID=2072847 RepID=A0A369QKK4_9BACT|nr:two-component regulator propeller domain-containing protein [Adhaeribacter pallidiroseus]RDC65264.1 hypothetical protein AHMF7616_03894 [Adhaeribacter pallidiroseus]